MRLEIGRLFPIPVGVCVLKSDDIFPHRWVFASCVLTKFDDFLSCQLAVAFQHRADCAWRVSMMMVAGMRAMPNLARLGSSSNFAVNWRKITRSSKRFLLLKGVKTGLWELSTAASGAPRRGAPEFSRREARRPRFGPDFGPFPDFKKNADFWLPSHTGGCP